MWGIFIEFEKSDKGYIQSPYRHVVPCDKNKEMQKGHIMADNCACHPSRDEKDPFIVVHEMLQ